MKKYKIRKQPRRIIGLNDDNFNIIPIYIYNILISLMQCRKVESNIIMNSARIVPKQ